MADLYVHQRQNLISRLAIDDSDGRCLDLIRDRSEQELRAVIGRASIIASIIEERETRRYFDREHRPCPKNGEWTYMELTVAWYSEAPPGTPKT